MTKEDYDKIGTVMPLGGVVDNLLSQLRTALQDATNQAENGSQLGVAVALGRANTLSDELYSCWLSVKE